MKEYARESRPWVIWLTIAAVILAGIGIFFYYTLFRQSKSELIEAVPTDAAFLFVINDNDAFVSGTEPLINYMNELFVIDALPAFETMRSKLPDGDYDLTVSGHTVGEGLCLLFNMHADKAAFKRLLRALSIDPNNYVPFENNRIYTYGTNYKSVKFAYVNHIISFSTDLELLKRAIVQHTHPKNLLSAKPFKEVYELTEKNRKQNWLVFKSKTYLPYLSSFLQNDLAKKVEQGLQNTEWAAFQLRFSGKDIFLSGYMFTETPESDYFDILVNRTGDGMGITDIYPAQCHWYTHLETQKVKELNRLKKYKEEETAYLKKLSPSEVGYFLISQDSVDYQYVIMLTDTSRNVLEAFYGDKVDSAQEATPDGIYLIPNHLAPLMKMFAPDSVGCFIQKNNALVFAPSKEAMKVYQNSMKTSGSLSQNRYYPFVNEAVASSSVMNFVLFNNENDSHWQTQLSDKGKASQFGQNLRILSVSCETMGKGKNLVPVNLYLHF